MVRNMHNLVAEFVKVNKKRYGHSTGNAMAMGALMAHVGFFLSGDDPEYTRKNLEARIEELLIDIVAGEGVED